MNLLYRITNDDNAARCIAPTPTFEFRPPQPCPRELELASNRKTRVAKRRKKRLLLDWPSETANAEAPAAQSARALLSDRVRVEA